MKLNLCEKEWLRDMLTSNEGYKSSSAQNEQRTSHECPEKETQRVELGLLKAMSDKVMKTLFVIKIKKLRYP